MFQVQVKKERWEIVSIFTGKFRFSKPFYGYLTTSFLLLVATYIYEQFSHEVYSNFMRTSFLIPLIGGIIVTLLVMIFKLKNPWVISFWNMGLTSLVYGFLLHGIFDIYGTFEPLVYIFIWLGGLLCLASIVIFIYSFIRKN